MTEALAIHGGRPVRSALLPYGRHGLAEEDVQAVIAALRSDWLTTGPAVGAFEGAVAELVGARHAVAVSSGTAALHAAAFAAGVGPGDEVIVPALTFAASANAACYLGATPVFADVRADTLNVGSRRRGAAGDGEAPARSSPSTTRGSPPTSAGSAISRGRTACRSSRTPRTPSAPSTTVAAWGRSPISRRSASIP